MGGVGGDAAAAAVAAAEDGTVAGEGRASPMDDDGSEAEHSSSGGDLGAETHTPLLQQPRDAPAHAEAAEMEQMAADMPNRMQVGRFWLLRPAVGEHRVAWREPDADPPAGCLCASRVHHPTLGTSVDRCVAAGGHKQLWRGATASERLCAGSAGQRQRSLVARRLCAEGQHPSLSFDGTKHASCVRYTRGRSLSFGSARFGTSSVSAPGMSSISVLLQGGAYRAAVLAHKASVKESSRPAGRQRSASAMQRSGSGLDALHEGDEDEDGGDNAANEGARSC